MAQLKKLVSILHIDDSVVFPGHISLDDLVTYYRAADLFLSMVKGQRLFLSEGIARVNLRKRGVDHENKKPPS
jgi:hypothetical protein